MSRLFQSGGIVAWGIFGGNRYLSEEPEKGNRFAVTFARCAFLYMARHRITRYRDTDNIALDTSFNRYIAVCRYIEVTHRIYIS